MPVPKLEVKSVPIAYILQNLGYELRGRGEMFCSPLREDANPSFHINSKSNVWYDHGLGEGGDNIRLVQRLTGKSYHDALGVYRQSSEYRPDPIDRQGSY